MKATSALYNKVGYNYISRNTYPTTWQQNVVTIIIRKVQEHLTKCNQELPIPFSLVRLVKSECFTRHPISKPIERYEIVSWYSTLIRVEKYMQNIHSVVKNRRNRKCTIRGNRDHQKNEKQCIT